MCFLNLSIFQNNHKLFDTLDKKHLQTNYLLYAEKDTRELLSRYFSGEVNSEFFDEIISNIKRDFLNRWGEWVNRK